MAGLSVNRGSVSQLLLSWLPIPSLNFLTSQPQVKFSSYALAMHCLNRQPLRDLHDEPNRQTMVQVVEELLPLLLAGTVGRFAKQLAWHHLKRHFTCGFP